MEKGMEKGTGNQIFISTKQKSIYDYIVDSSMYVNKNECNDYNPPFLTYIPSGVPTFNIDIENNLRGTDRLLTKCPEYKYIPQNKDIATNLLKSTELYVRYPNPNRKKEC
jgi:hypothetical protein